MSVVAIAFVPGEQLGLLGRSRSRLAARLEDSDVAVQVKLPPPEQVGTFDLCGMERQVALPITFTPFADCDIWIARNAVEAVARWLDSKGFELTTWGEPLRKLRPSATS